MLTFDLELKLYAVEAMSEEVGESQKAEEKRVDDAPQTSPPSVSEEKKKGSDHTAQCRDMFEKIAEYLNGELAGALRARVVAFRH